MGTDPFYEEELLLTVLFCFQTLDVHQQAQPCDTHRPSHRLVFHQKACLLFQPLQVPVTVHDVHAPLPWIINFPAAQV